MIYLKSFDIFHQYSWIILKFTVDLNFFYDKIVALEVNKYDIL